MTRLIAIILALMALTLPAQAQAQTQGPLRIEITEGVIEPLPFAVPSFVAANDNATQIGQNIAEVIAADLEGTGLFRTIQASAYISQITSFTSPVQFSDWKAINAQALVTGQVSADASGSIHHVGAQVQGAAACNGWAFWCFEVGDVLVPIDSLRERLRAGVH